MLHELFLLLSGNPSPLLTPTGLPKGFPLVSPSERALLETLAILGHLHISLRHACATIATSHTSTIARAVASGIETHHLQAFRTRILAVEESILKRDSGTVGGYDVISLAKVQNSFEGWDRTLRYVHDLVEFISPGCGTLQAGGEKGTQGCGADIINRLRKDIHTGYPTIEAVALHLLKIAEMAWLRELSTWVLYGRLPSSASYGSDSPSPDFFITEVEGDEVQNPGGEEEIGKLKEYLITKQLHPTFVTPDAASSLLFIGRALSMIRLRGGSVVDETSSSAIVASPEMTLLPIHLSYLQSLQSPISPQKLNNVISSIRLSLSKHTLQTLLPAEKMLDAIYVLREFFLLGRGEFALAIVEQASEAARSRWRGPGSSKTPGKASAVVKEGEVSAILTRTWGVLASLQGEEAIDERLDTARDLLYLSLYKIPSTTPATKKTGESFRDALVGVPVSLNFHLSWPLELFLQPSDLDEYDALFAYLIAVRKTETRLQSLWRNRRYPPARVYHAAEREEANHVRTLLRDRHAHERAVWATASAAVFFLETLLGYWQGEVIQGAFEALAEIVTPAEDKMGEDDMDDDEDIWTKAETSEPPTVTPDQPQEHRDPESLMRAHQAYLDTIKRNTFLADTVFAPMVKKFLQASGLLAAGIEELKQRHTMEDLDLDGMRLSSERREMERLAARCNDVRQLLKQLVGRLHDIDEERDDWAGDDILAFTSARPQVGKVDRLLMKMDLGNL